jgi:hypothetical protein
MDDNHSSTEGEASAASNSYSFEPPNAIALGRHLADKNPGETVLMRARVRPADDASASENNSFRQMLSFTLRVGTDTGPSLPLEPRFVHFEDPEYNRRLASSSARASVVVETTEGLQTEMRTVTLAADRHEYNPDGCLAVRYDWDAEPENVTTKLRLRSIDAYGVPRDLRSGLETFAPGTLVQLSLADLQYANNDERVTLRPGQTLQLELLVHPQGKEPTPVLLSLGIVAAPITPVPEAACALLRQQVRDETRHVECTRFAWGLEPDRVELVCPADLQTEVVRRRAVFRWEDSSRPVRPHAMPYKKSRGMARPTSPRQQNYQVRLNLRWVADGMFLGIVQPVAK